MSEMLKDFLMKGVELLALPSCKIVETMNPFCSEHLGDRSKYFGASEMAAECQRKPVLERLYGRKPFELHSIIVMAIGHMIEVMIYLIFVAQGKKPQREVALYHPDLSWCRATADFIWLTQSGAKIMELKSSKECPDVVRTSHFNQIILQMGIWLLNNPGKTVSGVVMVVDRVCGEIREYPVEYDHYLFLGLIDRAKASWAAIQGEGELPEASPNGLCGFCSQRDKCPYGIPADGPLPLDIAEAAERLLHANTQIKQLKLIADSAKKLITAYSGGHRLKGRGNQCQLSIYYKAGKASIDHDKIKQAMAIRFSEEEIAEIYVNATSKGKPSPTVEVKPL